jgi:hypothetical protein
MHKHTLTLSLAAVSAPISSSSRTNSVCPNEDAIWRAVIPSYSQIQQYPQEKEQQVSYQHSTPHAQHAQHSPVPQLGRLLPSPAEAAQPLGVSDDMQNAEPSTKTTRRCINTRRKKSSRSVTNTQPRRTSKDSTHLILNRCICTLLQQQPHHL